MMMVGCAGFPVPPTRYFKEFMFVEVQETPGQGTVRRWKREAPSDFNFALLGPRDIGQEGFRGGKVIETALKILEGIGAELNAKTAVFIGPPEFTNNKANKATLQEFLADVKKRFDRVVFEPGAGWDSDECDALAHEVGALASRDPLTQGISKLNHEAYYRLHGPAGRKSRYEDPAIERLAELARNAKHEKATYVFTNDDMFADAKRFKKAFKGV
jgi:uncharacterized protein YecE (DUF72 family)